MVLIYENTKLVGVADDIKNARSLFEEQFNESTTRGYFMNSKTKGLYKIDWCKYSSIKAPVLMYESTNEEDPTYSLVQFETNQFLPGCEMLPTISYD